MNLLILLACTAGKDPAASDALVQDTAQAGDTAEAEDTASGGAADWLVPSAVWGSVDIGHSTGGAFTDVDGDGDLDLLVSNGNDMSQGTLVIYENRGGVLLDEPSWSSETPRYYGHMDIGDVNMDGWDDVVISRFLGADRFDSPGGVELFLNRGGSLPSTPDWTAEGFFSFSCALGDMDGDGDLDLAVAVGEAYRNEPDLSLVFENDGTGDLGPGPVWATEAPRHSFDVGWADLNGDGALDLFFANAGSAHTAYLGPITSATGPAWAASGSGFEGNTLDLGDIDGDGHIDLVVSDNNQLGGLGKVRGWCGPDLVLCWTSADRPEMQSAVALEDVDGDGDLDLFAGAWWGAVRMYESVDG